MKKHIKLCLEGAAGVGGGGCIGRTRFSGRFRGSDFCLGAP